MLDRSHRLTRSQDFAVALRGGVRTGSTSLVVHLGSSEPAVPGQPVRVGLVVGRSVGNAVTRNQVKRRLRHLLRDRLSSVPDGSVLVVRALPPSAAASSAALGEELDRALARSVRRLTERLPERGQR
jgi:ribonuclease P protein component